MPRLAVSTRIDFCPVCGGDIDDHCGAFECASRRGVWDIVPCHRWHDDQEDEPCPA